MSRFQFSDRIEDRFSTVTEHGEGSSARNIVETAFGVDVSNFRTFAEGKARIRFQGESVPRKNLANGSSKVADFFGVSKDQIQGGGSLGDGRGEAVIRFSQDELSNKIEERLQTMTDNSSTSADSTGGKIFGNSKLVFGAVAAAGIGFILLR